MKTKTDIPMVAVTDSDLANVIQITEMEIVTDQMSVIRITIQSLTAIDSGQMIVMDHRQCTLRQENIHRIGHLEDIRRWITA